MTNVGSGSEIEPLPNPFERHSSFRSHGARDFPFQRVAPRPFIDLPFGHTGGAQFPHEDLFRLLLCRVSHEHGGLIVLSLIKPDIGPANGVRT